MGRYQSAAIPDDPAGTNDEAAAAKDASGQPVSNGEIDKPGLYPFVSHAFAHVDLGQVGLLEVGKVKGTMSH